MKNIIKLIKKKIKKYKKKKNLSNFNFSLLEVKNPKNRKIRVGKDNDGGYIIVDNLEYDLIIGCGISDDISFEKDMSLKFPNIEILAYDGTIDNLPESNNKIQFIKKNISDKETNTTTNLKNVIRNYKNILLKMDIEGGEYPFFNSLNKDELNKFNQIVIEIHNTINTKLSHPLLTKLNTTHNLVHIHANNYSKVYVDDDKILPNVIEVTYIRKDYEIDGFNTLRIPTDLDMPNKKKSKDVKLENYPYCFPK